MMELTANVTVTETVLIVLLHYDVLKLYSETSSFGLKR